MMLDVKDEGGAVLVLVTLMLLAIMGMTALVIDAGAVLVVRRRMVAVADSASLAAAQACAQGEDPQVQADILAEGNVGEADGGVVAPACFTPTGTAHAEYTADQELLFAPAVGVSSPVDVGAGATAMWGPSRQAQPVPLALGDFDPANCIDGCPFWLDLGVIREPTSADAVLASRRLCDDDSFTDWIAGLAVAPTVEVNLALEVCTVPSDEEEDFSVALESLEGDSRLFLIAEGGHGNPRRIDTLGFRPLHILSADRPVSGQDDICDPFVHDFTASAPDNTFNIFEAPSTLLCGIPLGATLSADPNKGPTDKWGFEGDPDMPEYGVIKWLGEDKIDDVAVTVSWETPSDALSCEDELLPRVVSDDEICLVLSWEGPRAGGSRPSMDATDDYGLRAVRLTE